MAFDFQHHRIAFAMPDHLSDVESWQEHIPFAFAVTAMTRPRILVELGTHKGDSYGAFCQAVATLNLPTRCYAVDTWQGDEHVGTYGDDVLNEVRGFHDGRYASFSTLVRKTFDDAARDFADGSIDLLHIDGLHTYDAVRHDFGTWLSKLSLSAVVLFHDTAVHDQSFGVWKYWEEARNQYPSFAFSHGHGLGVLAVGPESPQAVKDLCALPEDEAKIIRALYGALGARVRHCGRERYIPMMQAMVRHRDAALEEHAAVIHSREREAAEAWAHARAKETAAETLWQELQRVQAARAQTEAALRDVQSTLIWRGYSKLRRMFGARS